MNIHDLWARIRPYHGLLRIPRERPDVIDGLFFVLVVLLALQVLAVAYGLEWI
jgi:hypothetical protein